jgi:hypothetical protein
VCGALQAAGASPSCSPAAAGAWSSPSLPGEIAALDVAFSSLPPIIGTSGPSDLPLPRSVVPTVQIQPWTFPMPIEESCPTCVVSASRLSLPVRGQSLRDAVLVVQFTDETIQALALSPPDDPLNTLTGNTPYVFTLPPTWGPIQSAYLTGFDTQQQYSVTEQIFVQP